ncbi:MAG TPA: hypothetical protein VEB66_04905 [Opitutaceae bacterium]|nr:hypothetical protein [Opitutaceae bacterium]
MQRTKVAQFGLGPIGLESLRLAATIPTLEIVGAVDNDPAKAGRSLADLTGVGALDGLTVVRTVEDLFRENPPTVILHTASSSAATTFAQMRPALELGVNVVSTCEELIFPALRAPALAKEYDVLCRHAGARIVATGVNPGFVMDALPICLTGVCREVEAITIERVVDAATRRQPLQAKIGSGQPAAAFRERLASGRAGHAGLRESLALVAHALGWTLDAVHETAEPVVAAGAIRTEFFDVAPGQVCGIHQRAVGLVGGRERVVLDLQMYLGAPDPRDVIVVRGRPDLHLRLEGGVAGDTATIAALVNTVPRLLAAAPGLRLLTELALPVWTGRKTG